MGMLAKKLGSRIKELREKRGFTQFKLAEILDMEASNLSKIERGVQIPKEESLINIAKALNTDIDNINVKATTEEGLGFTGNKEGIASQSVCLLFKIDSEK